MGLTNNLRGAMKWNAAEEASVRISAVRSQLERNGGGGDANTSQGDQVQRQLRHGMSELDSVKQFLHDGINTGNRAFVEGGAKDQQLHHALEKGLQECEVVRQRLMTAMKTNNNNSTSGNSNNVVPTARHKVEMQEPTTATTSKRPPSATTRKPLTGNALHSNQGGANNNASTTGASSTGVNGRKMFLGRSNSMTGGLKSGANGNGSTSAGTGGSGGGGAGTSAATASSAGKVRPQSATTSSLRRAQFLAQQKQQQTTTSTTGPTRQTAGQAWGDNSSSAKETTSTPTAPSSGGAYPPQQPATSNPTASSGTGVGAGGLKASSMKSRPSSAPNQRGVRQPPTVGNTPQQQQQQQQQNQQEQGGDDGNGQNGTTAWNKYQDWAQTVLNRVQNRRVQQQRTGSFSKQQKPVTSANTTTEGDQQFSGIRTTTIRPTSAKVGNFKVPPTNNSNTNTGGTAPATPTSGGSATNLVRKTSGLRPQSANVRGAQQQDAQQQQQQQQQQAQAQQKMSQQAQSLREQGNVLFQQRKYGDSADCYSRALALEPNSETLYCNRAAAYLMYCKFDEALQDSLKAVELDPGHVKAHWRSAKAYLYLGNGEQARHWYQKAARIAEAAGDVEAISVELKAVDTVEKCRRCLRLREWTEALRCADQILEVFPPNGPCSMPWMCLKAEAMIHTDAQEAGALLTRMCQEDPNQPDVWCLRAKALFYAGHDACSTNSAVGYIKRAKELEHNHAKSVQLEQTIESFEKLRDEGNSAYAGGRWQEAYLAYTKCLTVDPYNSSLKAIILCNRAAVCIQCERWKDAMDDINQSIGFNPQNAKAYSRRARIHQHQNSHEAAVKDLQLAVQMYPSAENQERLTQAIELKNQAARQRQQNTADNAKFRYFNFANGQQQGPHGQGNTAGGTGGPGSRPSTAGTRRPGATGPQRPQSATVKPAAERRPSHYDVLAVERKADDKTLTKAYREAALKWHPDKWATQSDAQKKHAEDMFKNVSTSYNILKDTQKRRQYDLTI